MPQESTYINAMSDLDLRTNQPRSKHGASLYLCEEWHSDRSRRKSLKR